MEIRWIIRGGWDGPEKVLQYRTRIALDNTFDINHKPVSEWTEWTYVPVYDEYAEERKNNGN